MIVEITKGQQITLPASIRKKYGWKPGTKINLEETKEGVKLESLAERTLEEQWAEADKFPFCSLTPEELNDIWERELLRR